MEPNPIPLSGTPQTYAATRPADTFPAEPTAANPYLSLAREIAEVTHKKQKAYGDSLGSTQGLLRVLYPDGIPIEEYRTAAIIIRVLDKLKRVVTDKTAMGENPWRDVAGYALIEALECNNAV